ncbi:MAG: adenylate/guanylate cyclase domain-containing protein, partial [Pseudomonadota bacterium]
MKRGADTPSLAQRMIARSDRESERLIGILRASIAFILFIGLSMLLSQAEATGIEARSLELTLLLFGAASYFCVGIATIYFSAPHRFRPILSWVFNFAEIGLLAFQVFVDVAVGDRSSLMALASPLLLLAAIVICIQALRYRLNLHIVSAVGLIAIMAVILFHDPKIDTGYSPAALEEFQVLYSPPPNVMRLAMLSALALIIGIAVWRSNRLVREVARETEIAENRKRFLPRELVERVDDAGMQSLRTGEERYVVAMFVDIRGFTALSESMSTKEMAAFLGSFRQRVMDAVVEHDGLVDKFIGDGALAIFGLRCDAETAAIQALEAGCALHLKIMEWNAERRSKGKVDLRIA